MDDYINTKEACQMLGCDMHTIQNNIRKGVYEGVKYTKNTYYIPKDQIIPIMDEELTKIFRDFVCKDILTDEERAHIKTLPWRKYDDYEN